MIFLLSIDNYDFKNDKKGFANFILHNIYDNNIEYVKLILSHCPIDIFYPSNIVVFNPKEIKNIPFNCVSDKHFIPFLLVSPIELEIKLNKLNLKNMTKLLIHIKLNYKMELIKFYYQ